MTKPFAHGIVPTVRIEIPWAHTQTRQAIGSVAGRKAGGREKCFAGRAEKGRNSRLAVSARGVNFRAVAVWRLVSAARISKGQGVCMKKRCGMKKKLATKICHTALAVAIVGSSAVSLVACKPAANAYTLDVYIFCTAADQATNKAICDSWAQKYSEEHAQELGGN